MTLSFLQQATAAFVASLIFVAAGGDAFAQKNIARPGPMQTETQDVGGTDEAEHASDELLDLLMMRFGRTLGVLDRAFPEDRRDFVLVLSELADAGGGEATLYDAAVLRLEEMVQERRTLLAGASDEALTATLMARSNFVDIVTYFEGGLACTAYILDGAPALTSRGGMLQFAAELDQKYALFYNAIANAHDGGPEPEEPSEDDFAAFKDYILAVGGSEEQLSLINELPDASDAEACKGIILMLEAAGSMPGEAGKRVRWQVARNTAELL